MKSDGKASYVQVKVVSDRPERFLNMCRHRQIGFWNINRTEEGFNACITRQDFLLIKDICYKTGTKVRITKKVGVPFLLFKYRKHYSFLVGILLSCAILYLCGLFVWNISFTGNSKYTNSMLLKFLRSMNVYSGMQISKIDCDNIESSIRNEYPDITWVSAEISGTRLIVHIKENDVATVTGNNEDNPRDIVAAENGIVHSIITRKGTPMVKVGDTVEKGQILVSGVVKILNDAGEHVGNIYTEADADIIVSAQYEYYDKLNMQHESKIYTGSTKTKKIFGFVDRDIELNFSFGTFENYDVITKYEPCMLTESFYLPFYFGSRVYYEYNEVVENYTEDEAKAELSKHFNYYIEDLVENKVQIIEYNVKMYTDSDSFVMSGSVNVLTPVIEYRPVTDIEIKVNEENKNG